MTNLMLLQYVLQTTCALLRSRPRVSEIIRAVKTYTCLHIHGAKQRARLGKDGRGGGKINIYRNVVFVALGAIILHYYTHVDNAMNEEWERGTGIVREG